MVPENNTQGSFHRPTEQPAQQRPSDPTAARFVDPAFFAEPGIRFALATVVTVLTLIVLSLPAIAPAQITTVLVIVTAVASNGLGVRWQLALALVAWAFLTGFAYGEYGELTFDPPALKRLLLCLAAIPLIARISAHAYRSTQRHAG